MTTLVTARVTVREVYRCSRQPWWWETWAAGIADTFLYLGNYAPPPLFVLFIEGEDTPWMQTKNRLWKRCPVTRPVVLAPWVSPMVGRRLQSLKDADVTVIAKYEAVECAPI